MAEIHWKCDLSLFFLLVELCESMKLWYNDACLLSFCLWVYCSEEGGILAYLCSSLYVLCTSILSLIEFCSCDCVVTFAE